MNASETLSFLPHMPERAGQSVDLLLACDTRPDIGATTIGAVGWQAYTRCSFVFLELKLQADVS
jgi:hypothetical protein